MPGSRRVAFRWVDGALAGACAAAGLVAYTSTLAPGLLDGDAALFQYTPAVLGVTYPTGYPTYMVLGYLWAHLVPVGSLAYRMNLLSAVCAAPALALLYLALRRLYAGLVGAAPGVSCVGISRAAALAATALFATLPTYWRWASEAKSYTLHILFLAGMLYLLSRLLPEASTVSWAGEPPRPEPSTLTSGPAVRRRSWPLWLAALLFGLALGNHSTALLLAPGLVLFYWLNCRPACPRASHSSRATTLSVPLLRLARAVVRSLPVVSLGLLLPLLLYLYVPMRAGWWLERLGSVAGLTVPAAVANGLVTEYYRPGLGGLVRYFTAADFTRGVLTSWGLVPQQLLSVYWPLVRADFSDWGALLAGMGALVLAVRRPRAFWPLCLMYAGPVPFVLTYGQGEQSAFLLASSLMLAIFAGAAVAGGLQLIQHFAPRARPGELIGTVAQLAWLAAVLWLPVHQAGQTLDWLSQKWNDATYQYWTAALAHPMPPGAGILAHWGDLTSMWYLQHAEGLRPDLYGVYPPTPEVVDEWLAAGHSLFVAGPLQGWQQDWADRYQFLPWGRLVQLAPRQVDALSLLPALPEAPPGSAFGGRLRLLRTGLAPMVPSGGALPVTLAWQAVTPLPADARISLRLAAADGALAAQSDDTLLSGWLPITGLPAGQVLLTFHRFKVPAGTLPGGYRLELALTEPGGSAWKLEDGQPILQLGQVTIAPADPAAAVDAWDEYKPFSGADCGGEIRLAGYDYSVTRARQGRGFAARLLWQAIRPPTADYTLLAELVDPAGQVWRDWHHAPAGGRAPTSSWAAGQPVRDQVDLVLPANAPPGQDTLRLRLTWLRPDGGRLACRPGWLPAWLTGGDSLTLPGVQVVEEENRRFDLPPVANPVHAGFGDQLELLGYDLPAAVVQPGGRLALTLFWRSRSSDIRASYSVFVHLVGPDGAIRGQQDKAPGERGKRPTSSWLTGEVIVDPVELELAPDAPPGSYQLWVGMYLASTGERLPVQGNTAAAPDNALPLATLRVGE